MLRYFSLFLVILFLLSGCSVKTPQTSAAGVETLSITLQSLDPAIPRDEAKRLSNDIYQETKRLTREFELVSPPQFHNFLVNTGFRKRGLCYHFADALYLHLKSKRYQHFDFHLVGANIGDYWKEHNALVVTQKGCSTRKCVEEKSILVDAWRDSGRLYYAPIKDDIRYEWMHRKSRCERSE